MTPNETYQIKSNNLEIKVGSGQFGNYDCNKTSINLIQGSIFFYIVFLKIGKF